MAALLEHAGHLSETLNKRPDTVVPFSKCLRFVVYKFFNGDSRDSYIKDIETSAIFHQECLTHKSELSPTTTPLDTPKWISVISSTSDSNIKVFKMIQEIEGPWGSWNPREDIGQIMKRSIDDLI
jgi:hypothetical protein